MCLLQGFLLKANREYRKSNLIGGKYKRRWVELTSNTLVYAASQKELLTGRIQVFSVAELVWVKAVADNKFQARFPERSLTFKVEAGSSTERDKWVSALQAAQQERAAAAKQATGAAKFEQLLKNAEQQLLGDTDDGITGSTNSTAHQTSTKPANQAGTSPAAATSGRLPLDLLPPKLSVAASNRSETGQQQPSPRSLLASARAGQAFVASAPDTASMPALGIATGWRTAQPQASASEAGESDEAADNGDSDSSEPDVGGSLAQMPNAAERPGTAQNACRSSSHSSSPRPASSPAQDTPCDESGPAAGTGLRRGSLTRRVTPGVMLLNTSAPSSASPSLEPLAAPGLSSCCSSNTALDRLAADADAGDGLLVLEPALLSPAAVPSCSPRAANAAGAGTSSGRMRTQAPAEHVGHGCAAELSDEVLTLDPAELFAGQSGACGSAAALPAKAGGSSLPSSAPGSRPGSATYRPGSPRKSCLRTSNIPPGTPAADAAGAVDSNSRSSGQRVLSSPLSKVSVDAVSGSWQQSAATAAVGSPSEAGSQAWHDWDKSSDGGPSPGSTTQQVHSHTSARARGNGDGVVVLQADFGSGMPRIIKADRSWLDEDFDA